MRRFIITLTVLLLCSCEITETQTTAITVLIDRTDAYIPVPSSKEIKAFCPLVDTKNAGVFLKFQNITHTDINQGHTIAIKPYSVLDNTLQRSAAIQRFYTKIDTLIAAQNKSAYDYRSSSIIAPLVEQLVVLSKREATEKVLLLYSDIAEFSAVFNVYDDTDRQLLFDDPIAVASDFKSKVSIPELTGISLYIIYYPKTIEESKMFQAMLRVYREVFNDSGLDIHIGIDKKY